MRAVFCTALLAAVIVTAGPLAKGALAGGGPYRDGRFVGRIAYSCDGNHNDPDDWIASPVALAILAEAGLRDRLVHFDYNCILPLTDPVWEQAHREGVLGAAAAYGFDPSLFFDCRRQLDQAVDSIAQAINESTADNPLYFIIAGPMEVPYRGIQQSDPRKRQYVYCISHSRWNDGFASDYQFTCTKRTVIEQDVHWVQIPDQNRLLSFGRFRRPSPPDEFSPYFWMRDSASPRVQFLWQRMLASTRPDPSDAGMTYFLVTGDDACDPAKLKSLLDDRRPVTPHEWRQRVRIEAENFRHLEAFELEDRNDRAASHRLGVRLRGATGQVGTAYDEPFTRASARYAVEVRYAADRAAAARFRFLVNGALVAEQWGAAGPPGQWLSHRLADVAVSRGDELMLQVSASTAAAVRLDYIELVTLDSLPTPAGRATE